MFSFEKTKEYLSYNSETGLFTWIKHIGSAKPGKLANSIDNEGYVRVSFCGKYVKGHTLAWYFTHGEIVRGLDHINGDRSDNRISNLRVASPSENQMNKGIQKNNKTGAKGVSYSKKYNIFTAQIYVNGKRIFLGQFKNLKDARNAYMEASKIHHGPFSNTGQIQK